MQTALLARALCHPLRNKVLDLLARKGAMTQTEVGRELDAAPATARHHLLVLAKAGLVRPAGTRPGPRGIVERLFKAGPKRLRSFSTPRGTPEERMMREGLHAEVLESHRVGARIVRKEPARFYSLGRWDFEGSPSDLRRLFKAVGKAVNRVRAGAWRKLKGAEAVSVYFGIYPRRPDEE